MFGILTGRIEPRYFRDQHVREGGVRPQLIVEGVSFPDFVRACIQVMGLVASYRIIEDGPFRLDPDCMAQQAAKYAQPASYAERFPNLWSTYTLHVCECGDAGCYATFGSVVPYTHRGECGLLIDKCWGKTGEAYPVPSIFLPDAVWHHLDLHRDPVLPAEALQPTLLLTALLGRDVHELLFAYERDLQDILNVERIPDSRDPDVSANEAFRALFGDRAKA